LQNQNSILIFLKSSVLRLLIIPFSGIISICTTRLITNKFGIEEYAHLSVILSLSAILSFAELGLGAVILNTARNDDSDGNGFSQIFFKSFYLIFATTLGLVLVIIVMTQFDLLRKLLDLENSTIGPNAVGLSLIFLFVGAPFRLGNYLLIANGKNPTVILLQLLQSIITLIFVIILSIYGSSISTLIILSGVGNTIASILGFFLARRFIPRRANYRESRSQRLFKTAFPFFLVTFFSMLPLKVATVVLSWTSSPLQIAQFAGILSFFLPALSIIQYSAPQLWIEFRRLRQNNLNARIFFKNIFLTCLGLGLIGAVALNFVAPLIIREFINPALVGSRYLFLAFGCLFIVIAVNYPLGMFFTDQSGLKLQALMTGLISFIFIPTSIVFSQRFGTVGMVVTLSVAILLIQVVPSLLIATKKLR